MGSFSLNAHNLTKKKIRDRKLKIITIDDIFDVYNFYILNKYKLSYEASCSS